MPAQCKFSGTAPEHEGACTLWHPVVGTPNSLNMAQTLIVIGEK